MAQRQRAGLITPRSQDQNLLPVFIIRSFQNCQAVTTATFHRRGAEVARAAHNRKDIRSKRIVGIFQFAVFRTASLSIQHPYHRGGAGGARGAHNSEVTGSTPVAGIIQFAGLQKLPRCHYSKQTHAGVAQRKSA
jgi:hypothetical protein